MIRQLTQWMRRRREERELEKARDWWDRKCAVHSSARSCNKCGAGIDWQPDNAPQTLICERCYLKGMNTINLLDAPDADYHRLMDELEFEAFGRVITPRYAPAQPVGTPEVDADDDLRAAIADARAAQNDYSGRISEPAMNAAESQLVAERWNGLKEAAARVRALPRIHPGEV